MRANKFVLLSGCLAVGVVALSIFLSVFNFLSCVFGVLAAGTGAVRIFHL